MKSTHKQNLTGNRIHAQLNSTELDRVAEQMSDIWAKRILTGQGHTLDVANLRVSCPTAWRLTCQKVKATRQDWAEQEAMLRRRCKEREAERYAELCF